MKVLTFHRGLLLEIRQRKNASPRGCQTSLRLHRPGGPWGGRRGINQSADWVKERSLVAGKPGREFGALSGGVPTKRVGVKGYDDPARSLLGSCTKGSHIQGSSLDRLLGRRDSSGGSSVARPGVWPVAYGNLGTSHPSRPVGAVALVRVGWRLGACRRRRVPGRSRPGGLGRLPLTRQSGGRV